MLMFRHRFFRHACLLTALFGALAAAACNVPVFRYALERWEADAYEIVVFQRGPLTAEQQAALEKLEQAGRDGVANLVVNRVDLASEVPPPLRAVWEAQEKPSLPWLVARYPRHARDDAPAWAGPLNAESVAALLDSPARRSLTQKLSSGDAVVWLLLESGAAKADAEAAELIEAETQKLQQSLKLPEPAPDDPPIAAELPLKIAFSTLRVARSDPAERALVNLLLSRDAKLPGTKEPMLFPVFGRGRVIPPAIGAEIRPEALREMAEFLTGPCSCQVKEMNPGYDLLLSANWNALIGYQEVRLPEPPPLVSMSQFAATAASNATTATAKIGGAQASADGASAAAKRGALKRNLVVVLGAGVLCLIAASLAIKGKGKRSRG